MRTELLVILTPQVVAGGINGGSHLLDEDTERTIRNYSDPDGLYKLLENHRPAPKEAPSIEPIDAREPEADVELETQPSE